MPEVTDIISDISEEKLVKSMLKILIIRLQCHLKKSEEFGTRLVKTTKFDTFGGKGVKANFSGKEVIIGNRTLINEKKIDISKDKELQITKLENEGKTAVLIAIDKKFSGIIGISDTLKETSKDSIKELMNNGLKVYMITGDNKRTASAIANILNIKNVLAEVLPEDKANEVKKLQKKGEVVAFVGDGINDALPCPSRWELQLEAVRMLQ